MYTFDPVATIIRANNTTGNATSNVSANEEHVYDTTDKVFALLLRQNNARECDVYDKTNTACNHQQTYDFLTANYTFNRTDINLTTTIETHTNITCWH
jgi:cyclopropane fatty-acyl-phospholipid synthase-like methyltransferase